MRVLFIFATVVALGIRAGAQAPNVSVYREGPRHEREDQASLASAAQKLREAGTPIKLEVAREQLRRSSCELTLAKANDKNLAPREIWQRARQSHLRVGWAYLCTKCDQWHLNLAGGYVLTSDGATVTCYHVVQPGRDMREGCLVAADDAGKMFPVTEVLAANRYSDACIVRVAGESFTPLPLNTNVAPGDAVYCFSDPMDRRGYFSQGIVNRFYQVSGRRRLGASAATAFAPTRINVSTDWAPGSSGSAVLDECGNAIGHVSTISAIGENEVSDAPAKPDANQTLIVFHEAVSARDVLALIKPAR